MGLGSGSVFILCCGLEDEETNAFGARHMAVDRAGSERVKGVEFMGAKSNCDGVTHTKASYSFSVGRVLSRALIASWSWAPARRYQNSARCGFES